MLDVDNGAAALTTGANAGLYRKAGVRRAAAALRPGGRLAYWSADADPRFEAVLRAAGLEVEVERVRAHATAGGRHTLLVARAAAEWDSRRRRSRTGRQSTRPLQTGD
jgi:hypothetical protein